MISVYKSVQWLVNIRWTYDTLVLGDGAECNTGTTVTSDISNGDIGRVGFQGDTVITTLVDHVFCQSALLIDQWQTRRFTYGQ